jgi:hypothetical protein
LEEKELIKKFDEFQAKHDALATKSISTKRKISKSIIATKLAKLCESFFKDLWESDDIRCIELSFEHNHSRKIIVSPDGRSIVRLRRLSEYGSYRGTDTVYIFQKAPANTELDLRKATNDFFAEVEKLRMRKLDIDEILEKVRNL